jgi:lipopolysaccharide transport system ATP-binding protein
MHRAGPPARVFTLGVWSGFHDFDGFVPARQESRLSVSDVAIRVEGVGKEYRIGRLGPGETTIREAVANLLRMPLRHPRNNFPSSAAAGRTRGDRIWALKDVCFEVEHGEVVGIIGGNGAGKSTLLKILSRITPPTMGTVEIHGRVGSLLEVGTGFHQELTGRDNIFLNGAILGMNRRDILERFDDIVSFAEVEQFIDTPVKHYSTGMYLRLAFAVAAHLEPDIVIVDEVLAVGDHAFQQKCLAKMEAMGSSGRTVLLVSHNMATIERLCGRCFLFREGRLVAKGNAADIVEQYHAASVNLEARRDLRSHPGRTKDSAPVMTEVCLRNEGGEVTACIRMQAGLSIHVGLSGASTLGRPILGVVVKTVRGAPVFGVNNRFLADSPSPQVVTEGTISCHFASLPLMPGTYLVDLYCGNWHRDVDIVHEAVSFEVIPADVFGTGLIPPKAAGPVFWPATFAVVNGRHVSVV